MDEHTIESPWLKEDAHSVTLDVWIQLIVYLLFGGVFSTLGNLHLILSIAKCPRMRSRFFVIIFSLLLCRLLEGAQFACMAVFRILRIFNVMSIIQTRITCISLGFFLYTGVTLELLLLFFLALDRGVALFQPMRYRRLNKANALRICIGIYLLAFITKQVPVYIGIDLREEVACLSVYSATHPVYHKYATYIDLILIIAILCAYGLIAIVLHQRLRSLRRASARNEAILQTIKRQMSLLPTLRNVILVHCILTFTSRSLLLCVAETKDPERAFHLTVYAGMLTVMDLFANVIVLIGTNADIRRAAFQCCSHRFSSSIYIVNTDTNSESSP